MKKVLQILLFLTCASASFSQKEANIWYFGHNCGLDFNTTPPTTLTDGALDSPEGCASIADENGNLLFYSDGSTVYNKNHTVMAGGTKLNGNKTATQSAVIVPQPGNKNIYYLFTVDAETGIYGFRYSLIDMSLQGGYGQVIKSNIFLAGNVTEKVTAAQHANKKEQWVLCHEWDSNVFKAFKITKDSIFTTPVISSSGTIHEGDIMNSAGYMKVSPTGNKLALAIYYDKKVELFDFDNTTGIVSNPITFENDIYDHSYGIEFSPNGSKLYFSSFPDASYIFQVNLKSGITDSIKKSVKMVVTNPNYFFYGALQVAPDGKIYVAKPNKPNLAAIDFPDEPVGFLRFSDSVVSLKKKLSGGGLPTFIQSYFKADSLYITANSPICEGDTIHLMCQRIAGATYKWDGPNDFTSVGWESIIPDAKLKHSGQYNCLVVLTNGQKYYITIDITVGEKPIISIDTSGKTTFCEGDSVSLSPNPMLSHLKYIWSTGESSLSIKARKTGLYSLIATNKEGCSDTAFVAVNAISAPAITFKKSNENRLCDGDSVEITAESGGTDEKYKWSTGDSTSQITIKNSGYYSVTVTTILGCTNISGLNIDFGTRPKIKLLPSSNFSFCSNDSIKVETETKYLKYFWSNGFTSDYIFIKSSGNYSVTVEDSTGCSATEYFTAKESQISADYNTSVIFGDVCIGEKPTRKIIFNNTGNTDFSISGFHTLLNNQYISITSTRQVPASINPGEVVEFSLIYDPQQPEEFSDSLIIEIDYPCARKFAIFLSAKSIQSIIAYIPDTTFKADGSTVSIPVIAKNRLSDDKKTLISYDAEVSFDARSFMPESGNYDFNNIIDGIRYLRFSGNNVEIESSGTILKSIRGKVMIGDSIHTLLRISSFKTNINELCLVTNHGWLRVQQFCNINLNKFKRINSVEVFLIPNPADDFSKLTLNNHPADNLVLKLYNLQGELIVVKNLKISSSETVEYSYVIDMSALPNGMYYLWISSSSLTVIKPIIIAK